MHEAKAVVEIGARLQTPGDTDDKGIRNSRKIHEPQETWATRIWEQKYETNIWEKSQITYPN